MPRATFMTATVVWAAPVQNASASAARPLIKHGDIEKRSGQAAEQIGAGPSPRAIKHGYSDQIAPAACLMALQPLYLNLTFFYDIRMKRKKQDIICICYRFYSKSKESYLRQSGMNSQCAVPLAYEDITVESSPFLRSNTLAFLALKCGSERSGAGPEFKMATDACVLA